MQVIIPPAELMGQPDILAMLQAFYSRSHKSVADRISELTGDSYNEQRIRESLKTYYVNYNHESIGDCGDLTVFIEGVSFLTAKAIQDHPLYNGQETSSRYIDFSSQPRPDYATKNYDHWMDTYSRSLEPIRDHLAENYMPDATEQALKVATFDVARGLLPCGAKTQLSWHGHIRTFREHLQHLLAHPIRIVREDAVRIHQALADYMPDMFADLQPVVFEDWFADNFQPKAGISPLWANVSPNNRSHLRRFGTSVYSFNLDYGSYRDLQRHRPAYIKSSIPSTLYGPEQWYLDRMPVSLSQQIEENWDYNGNDTLGVPMLSKVNVMMVTDLQQLAYMVNLRTKSTVHQTLRNVMHKVVDVTLNQYGNIGFLLNVDRSESNYARRSTQGIMKDGKDID